jgi:type I restriction enzyme S subunit
MREGWEVKKLGQVSNVQRGLTYGRNDTVDISENIVLRATNIKLESNSLDFNDLKYLTDDFEIKDIYKLKVGSLLICFSSGSKNHLGKVAIVEEPYAAAFGGFIGQITPNEIVIPRYLFYNLISDNYRKYISELTDGMNINNLKSGDLKQFPIPIPPIQEQKQIVKILDKAFTAIDQAKANIEKNIVNAKELFQSKLNAIFSQKGEGWEEKKLKEITTKIGSGATPRGGQSSYKESGISLIRSMNVHDDGFRDKKLAFIDDEQANKLSNVTIEENDVLLNITGASVARCCIVDKQFLPARVNQHVSIIRLKEGIMSNKFLHFALTSKETKSLLLGIGEQGATRQAITKVQIENFKIAFPSIIEAQDELLKSLGILQKKTIQIESNYIKKLEDLEELKKSILQKAFSGELTQKEVEV